MRSGPVLAAVLLLSLAACTGEEEEKTSLQSISDMSAGDIIDRVVQAGDAIKSVQAESTHTQTQFAKPFPDSGSGGPQTTRETRITTAEGSYNRHELAEEDACPPSADWCASSPFGIDETLWYKGKSYFRIRGEWVDEATCQADPSKCGWTGFAFGQVTTGQILVGDDNGSADCEGLRSTPDPDATIDPALLEDMNLKAAALYSMDFQNLKDIELLGDDVVAGAGAVHLKAGSTMDLGDALFPPKIRDVYEKCGLPVPTLPPEAGMFQDLIPDSIETAYELWVNDAFQVLRITSVTSSYREDRLLYTDTAESTFSLFNVAQLPGPLPE